MCSLNILKKLQSSIRTLNLLKSRPLWEKSACKEKISKSSCLKTKDLPLSGRLGSDSSSAISELCDRGQFLSLAKTQLLRGPNAGEIVVTLLGPYIQ